MRRKVKRRVYDSRSRQEAAKRTRAAAVEAARVLFLRDGYAATTVAKIATAARVSVETIYKAFGGKPGLVRAMSERALAGAGPAHAEQRSDAMQARGTEPRAIFKAWAKLSTEIAPRVSPILLLVRDAAAHDPEMAAMQAELEAARLERMANNARTLEKFGVEPLRARDIMWTATSPELYELLVLKRGWPIDRYSVFLAQLLDTCLQPEVDLTLGNNS